MLLISLTSGEVSAGVGVGGFLVAIGLALLVGAFFEDRPMRSEWPPQATEPQSAASGTTGAPPASNQPAP